ncbi:MAG: TIR domain-containing protein [Vicinamibacterales bacterium]
MTVRWVLTCAVLVSAFIGNRTDALAQGFSNVHGYILDGEGNGIAGASVHAYRLQTGETQRLGSSTSETNGHYVINVPEGELVVSVEADGYSTPMARRVPGPSDTPVNFELSRLQKPDPSDNSVPLESSRSSEASGVSPIIVGIVIVVVGLASLALYLKSKQSANTSARVFISYRRAETADVTGRIYDRLVEHFGRRHVFKDVDSIRPGLDFRLHIQKELQGCQVAVVVIGDRWLSELGQSGMTRLLEPNDWVRLELEAVLQRGIPTIPALVKGASVPKEHELPSSIASLSYRAAVVVRSDPDFHRDVDRLIAGIEGNLRSEEPDFRAES